MASADKKIKTKKARRFGCTALALCLCVALAGCTAQKAETATTVAMDTIVEQRAYGPNAQAAMRQVNTAIAAWDDKFSLFSQDGDIARVNAAAGAWVEVAPETAALLTQAQALSAQSGGAFALTIAPLTLAWGVTGNNPRVPADDELAALLPLVDDAALEVDGSRVRLAKPGMGLDLGGIAKGAFCAKAAQIYEENGVDSALLWIGGNVYARGTKPGGEQYKVGFADPGRGADGEDSGAYIASFTLQDETVAVSGGYERYFEVDGKRYIHIIDPRTGRPVESDIASVGVIDPDGAAADFWSTTLFVWGRDKTLEHMRTGARVLMLDNTGTLYVSEALRDGFELHDKSVKVEFVANG